MSSLIEQAVERLAQLREAGAEPAPVAATAAPVSPPALPRADVSQPAQKSASKPAPKAVPGSGEAAPPRHAVHVPTPAGTSRQIHLNLESLMAAGFVTPNAPRSHRAEQYRVIKRPLIKNAMGQGAAPIHHGNLIMVTSALAGEGKSFTSINLAMSIAAELDNTVMLVDADVARPSVLRMLGLPPGPGLLDILESSADLGSVLLRTNIDKLSILPAGTRHDRATELLASDAMRQLLDDMASRYPDRIIIFDSPPLLLTTESRVLASNMGQIVVVVQADRTLQADVQHALSTIEACPVKMMLLNQARTDSKAGYGYGYGYGHGYGYGSEPESQAENASS
jgi:exopolysaccharide/PEP-CTERM locus tyrosine autokinase